MILMFIAAMSFTSCFDDGSDKKTVKDILSLGSIDNSIVADAPKNPDIPARPDIVNNAGGTITITFNVPSMKNAKVHGFIFDSRGAFKGEIGYNEARNLAGGKLTLAVRQARSSYSRITASDTDVFPDGTYTIHGKFDIHADGFDSDQGDKGFRVNFAVNGNTAISIEDADIINPCHELITSANRQDLKFATVYAYIYFPGGDPLHYYAYRYDGGTSYVKLNHAGNDIGNTMSEDLNSGVYDVLIIADMDDSIEDPFEPSLSNGDKYIVVKNMVIDGIDPIDISDYLFKTYISDLLPAPPVSIQAALNDITITIKNISGAASYNVYGRSTDGYELIGTIVRDTDGEYTTYTDFGPYEEYNTRGLPANMNLYYRVAAVKSNGVEGEPGLWTVVTSGGVQKPEIHRSNVASSTQLDLLIDIPRYCQEIEITAASNSCDGSLIGTYIFPVSQDQRDRGVYFSLTGFTLEEGMTYAFTVRGRDLHDDWSGPSSCYIFP